MPLLRLCAGMTYLKYANLCAEVLRGSLKEPFLTKARLGGVAWNGALSLFGVLWALRAQR
jgi:hypothetical protein